MIIFKDIVSGDEIINDSFKINEVDGVVYEATCKMVEVTDDNNINIGANPSAEEGDEGVDSNVKKGLDIVISNRLQYLGDEASKTPLFNNQKAYLGQLKTYLKALKEKLAENGATDAEIEDFKTRVTNYYSKNIKPNFANCEFYSGNSMKEDGMVVLLNWRDGEIPILTAWKDGLAQQKL